jgi:hypothetical protein
MKRSFFAILPGLALACLPLAAGAVTQAPSSGPAKPLRHLVYAFTFSESTDRTIHESGIGGPISGMQDSRGGSSDKGQIVADVVGLQKDTALIVTVSEQARDSRSAEPNTCLVYSNLTVICDQSKKVNDEELALLRFMGRNFVDADQIDAKNHWRVASSGPQFTFTSDFTVQSNTNDVLQIVESRTIDQRGAQAFTSAVDGHITYDLDHTVPTAISEDEMLRQSGGMGTYDTDHTQISLTLQTDSLAKAMP